MITRCVTTLAAVTLLTVALPTAHAEDATPKSKGAHSVAEMLQKRQDSQLREQLVREGRMEEVRKLDDAIAQRDHERQDRAVAQLNQDISRASGADQVNSALVDTCDRETLRLRRLKAAGDTTAASSTY